VKKLKNFANARIENLIREAGAFRVSAGAIASLNEIISQHGFKIAKKAVAIAESTGRRTIKEGDILSAKAMTIN
jgi:histone H3/H4